MFKLVSCFLLHFILTLCFFISGLQSAKTSSPKTEAYSNGFENYLSMRSPEEEVTGFSLEELENIHRQVRDQRLDFGLESASLFLDKAYKLKDSSNIAKGYHFIALVFSKAGDYEKALKNNLEALKIRRALGETKEVAGIYNNIGILFEKLGRYSQSLEFYNKSLSIYRQIGDQYDVALVLSNKGGLYGEMGETEKAQELLKKVITLVSEMDDHPSIGGNYQNIGFLYFQENQLLKAKEQYLMAKDIAVEKNETRHLANNLLHLGNIEYKLGNYSKAFHYLDWGINIAEKKGLLNLLSNLLEKKATFQAALNDYKNAYQNHRRHAELKDSLLNTESMTQIAFYQTLYESEKKERQISSLKKEQEVQTLLLEQQTLELEKSKLTNTALVFFLVISILTVFTIINYYKNKRKDLINEQALEAQKAQVQAIIKTQENERIRFAKDLHDGLGQLLTALKINCSTITNHPGNSNQRAIENASVLIRDMHQEIRNISFNIMPQILVKKGLYPAISELAARINLSENLRVSISEFGFTHRFEPAFEIAIYRIVQELLNNIIKYSGAENINLHFTQHEKELNIHIEDDGLGFDIECLEKSKGSGWKNICSRLKFINGNISFDTQARRKHSTVIIDIPI